jgi:predicted nucleic acid-binding Zn ribbon protein
VSELQRVGDHIRARVKLPSVDRMVLDARRVWADAVGETVARNSMPVRKAGDALVVHCSSSTWAGELSMLERQVLAGLAAKMDEPPTRLKFEVGRVLPPEAPAAPSRPLPPLTDEQRRQAQEMVAGVADEALARRILEAVELSMRRGS